MLRIDSTYPAVRFSYFSHDGKEQLVTTLEEEEYPSAYRRQTGASEALPSAQNTPLPSTNTTTTTSSEPQPPKKVVLEEAHLVFQENQRGVTFDRLFGQYLAGASKITITDPYLRMFHQQRNLMELLETISKSNEPGHELAVHVLTAEDEFSADKQIDNFQKIADSCQGIGISFSWEFDKTGTKHDRDITTDTGWKIVLSRGLDIFQRYELNEAFSFSNRLQQHRQCKEFNLTYVKVKK